MPHVVGHLPGEALRHALFGADLIVSRSGYTTLMDLAAIGRSALIIPTPGQQGQEYLGQLHLRSGRFLVQEQRDIDLHAASRWFLSTHNTRIGILAAVGGPG